MSKNSAIEILIYNPTINPKEPEKQRGVVVNPRLKQRFKQFVPIGVYLDGLDLKYYFFDQCAAENLKTYSSLKELEQDLPEKLENIFKETPKLFIMGHASGGTYGMGNYHNESEHLYKDNFDKLLDGFKQVLPKDHGEIFVTLEGCNTDNQLDAAANGKEKTFLEQVSEQHQNITFGGTGPWDPQDAQTGFRSLAPESPITSMAGNTWNAGNSVIFYHGSPNDQYQVAVRKSLFASTTTAKELKVNTIEYARAILDKDGSDELISQIALRRDILKIQDLKKIDGFPELQLEGENVSKFFEQEKQVLSKEQENYLTHVRDILNRADRIEKLTDRDVVELLLGLKEPSIFKDHEDLLESILANKALLQLAMVSCGKVLIGGSGGPSNDSVIDLLLEHDVNINSVDEKGNTALHYVAQNFYNYRKEPLDLIKKLLQHGANPEARNKQGQTPIDTAQEHSKDGRVTASDKLLESLKRGNSPPTTLELQQSVKQIFQMSQHKAHELLSLPDQEREYINCSKGTLYIPENVVGKLHEILRSVKGNSELLSAFESELRTVISDLAGGIGTGDVIDDSKHFDDTQLKLATVMDALIEMKQEDGTSKNAEVENQVPELKSQVQFFKRLKQEYKPSYMKSTESSMAKERKKYSHLDNPKPPWKL